MARSSRRVGVGASRYSAMHVGWSMNLNSIRYLCIPCLLAALSGSARHVRAADLGASEEALDALRGESTSASALTPADAPLDPQQPPAEIIPLPPSPRSVEQAKAAATPAAPSSALKTADKKSKTINSESAASEKSKAATADSPKSEKPASFRKPAEPGYVTVLSGTLTEDLELSPAMSPVLIRGTFIVPEKIKLSIAAGTVIHLRGDPDAPKVPAGTPDPALSAVVWIWGTLNGSGVTGNPAELLNQEKADASLLLYGVNECRLDGLRLKGVSVAQNGGVALWTNCEFVGTGSYAMAGGAALISQSTFRKFGGIFATYNVAPWSLLVRRNLFEHCREGIIIGSNPGEARLVVEQNHFVGTQGAHIRALPLAKPKAAADGKKPEDMEVLIGENWYGSSVPEEIDMRIVDRRNDPSIHARLNTRPPANQPYSNIGAGMKTAVLDATKKEQQQLEQKLLQAQFAKEKSLTGQSRQVARKGA